MTDPVSTRLGGCHCGAVRYEVETDLAQVLECNCSHCSRKGLLLAFVPADRFRLSKGEDQLTEYRFNTHKIRHLFCRVCGVQSFAGGQGPQGETRAINIRCLDDIDLGAVKTTPVDGRSF